MFLKAIISFIFLVGALSAAEKPYWVFLEKDPTSATVQLTPRAEQRVLQRGSGEAPGNEAVSEAQLAQLRNAGYHIRHASRFLNAVSVSIENERQLTQLQNFSFIKATTPVAHRPMNLDESISPTPSLERSASDTYGHALGQNQMLNIPAIHDLGYTGSGVLVGVFDTGFLTDHEAFDELDIQAQYDFIDHEVDASGLGHEHGSNVLSVLGGYSPGDLIGPAYKASFLLARTEDSANEFRSEEDNWVAALEWADSLGVDVINSSLTYFDEFDDPSENYPASALDGQTTIVARAANIAAARGILVVNSAGNEGPGVSSLWPPADSPHVLAVGSVNAWEEFSLFSGQGPTYDGRIKPDVVAQGSGVYMAKVVSGYKYGNGTSFSTPLIAGLAALLLQARPYLKPDSIISIFHSFGNNSATPDNRVGWGIPQLASLFPEMKNTHTKNCLVYPNPGQAGDIRMVLTDPVTDLSDQATLYDIRGREIAKFQLTQESRRVIKVTIPSSLYLGNQVVILSVKSNGKVYAGKFVFLKR